MERYFAITKFEDGWREEEFIYEESAFEYCTEALEIPSEKIDEISYNNLGMEISLNNLSEEDIVDDWYVNLLKISSSSQS